jgi:MFS family permease
MTDSGAARSADPHSKLWRRLLPDPTPLRDSRDFRLVWTAGLLSMLGSAFPLLVALPLQVKQVTGSPLAVAGLGLAELVPMLLFALYGGALADAVDRRRLVLATEVALAVLSAAMLANALRGVPLLWPLYVAAAAAASLQSLQWPAAAAMLPRLVAHDQLPAALAWESIRGNAIVIAGPALGGLLAASAGLPTVYAVDLATFAVSIALIARIRPIPPSPEAEAVSWGGTAAGLRYAAGRPELLGTYLMDVVATAVAVPTVLFVFLADDLHAGWALGLLYTAPAAGALLVGATSGWVGRVRRHGRWVAFGSAVWAAALLGAGLAGRLWLVLAALAVAGGGNFVADTFRSTIWNQSIPDRLRGRLAGIELLSGEIGPAVGQLRAGAVAARLGARAAIWVGGAAALGGVGALTAALPGLWRYDASTDPHVADVAEAQLRQF